MFVGLLVLALLGVVFYIIREIKENKLYGKIRWASGWLPVFGHGLHFQKSPENFILQEMRRSQGKPFVLQLMSNKMVIISSLEDGKALSKFKPQDSSFSECGNALFAMDVIFTELGGKEFGPIIPLIRGKLGWSLFWLLWFLCLFFSTAFVRYELAPRMQKTINVVLDQKIGESNTFHCLARDGGLCQKITASAVLAVVFGEKFALNNEALYTATVNSSVVSEQALTYVAMGMPRGDFVFPFQFCF